MAIAINGCANTKPVPGVAVDASPGKVDAVDERTDGLTEVEPETLSDEADAARQASADQCEPEEHLVTSQAVLAECTICADLEWQVPPKNVQAGDRILTGRKRPIADGGWKSNASQIVQSPKNRREAEEPDADLSPVDPESYR